MNYLIRLSFCLIFCIGITGAGCSDYLDVNEDPNNPTEAPMTGLMTNATFETSENMFSLGSVTSYYVQYLASPNQGSSTDIQDDVSYGDTWFRFYDVMTDLAVLRQNASEQGATEYRGVARILTALNLGTVVDVWGDVPYSEAFFLETLTPAYDNQEALYDSVFTLLDQGIQDLEAGGSTVILGEDDFIYQGDTDMWIRFAHFLKARYLNHLSKQSEYSPSDILAEVDDAFTSNQDDAQVEYFQEEFNPWAQVAINNADLLLGGWLSEQIINHMDGTTFGLLDPRIEAFTDTVDNGDYVGTRNGEGRAGAAEQGERSVLTTDTFYASETAPLLIGTYAEQKFIEAEAAHRDNQPARAYQAYLDGIEAHMDKMGVPDAEKNNYMNDPAVDVGQVNLTLDLIFKEKYTAMFLNPEAWVDARRYDYQYQDMELPENLNLDLNGQFIRRLIYPDSETQRNAEQVPDVTLLDRIWWDQE